MSDIPSFQLYGAGDPEIQERLQPSLALRSWCDLSSGDKKIILQQLENHGWLGRSREILGTISALNSEFLRQCPGKNLHGIPPEGGLERFSSNEYQRQEAAQKDFAEVLTKEKSESLVLWMLSRFATCYIEHHQLRSAAKETDQAARAKAVNEAYRRFDPFANCLNHIFEQFAVNILVTRGGFVPRQDARIEQTIYSPTLRALSDPKWRSVSSDLSGAFLDYREGNAAEAITKAHSAVQRFLQILVGDEGKNGRGEVGKLYAEAKRLGLIGTSRFSEQLVNVVQSTIVSERATNSTAKPAIKDAAASDALLVLNLTMVFLQHSLSATP